MVNSTGGSVYKTKVFAPLYSLLNLTTSKKLKDRNWKTNTSDINWAHFIQTWNVHFLTPTIVQEVKALYYCLQKALTKDLFCWSSKLSYIWYTKSTASNFPQQDKIPPPKKRMRERTYYSNTLWLKITYHNINPPLSLQFGSRFLFRPYGQKGSYNRLPLHKLVWKCYTYTSQHNCTESICRRVVLWLQAELDDIIQDRPQWQDEGKSMGPANVKTGSLRRRLSLTRRIYKQLDPAECKAWQSPNQ